MALKPLKMLLFYIKDGWYLEISLFLMWFWGKDPLINNFGTLPIDEKNHEEETYEIGKFKLKYFD